MVFAPNRSAMGGGISFFEMVELVFLVAMHTNLFLDKTREHSAVVWQCSSPVTKYVWHNKLAQ